MTLNGIVAHYDVEFSEQGLSSQMVNTGDTNLLLTGLNPSGVYVVRVRANNYAQLDLNENDVIPGPFTDIITVQLPDPLPSMLIFVLQCTIVHKWTICVHICYGM